MRPDNPSDGEVESALNVLGVDSLCQWDVLLFLYRHETSLVGADYIAYLLGYAAGPVVAALDVLESLGFVARSRVSQSVRLYQFTTPAEPPRGRAFERLRDLAGHRAGRLVLASHLRPGRTEGPQAARRARDEGRETWQRAI